MLIYALPNDKKLDGTKITTFADDKIKSAVVLVCCVFYTENIAGKGENAGYQHFLLFLQCFQKPLSLDSLKL